MTDSVLARWIVVGVCVIGAFALPYVVGAIRKRFRHGIRVHQLYAPHLIFLCVVRCAKMIAEGPPAPSATVIAFAQAALLWGAGVAASDWFTRRQQRASARGDA